MCRDLGFCIVLCYTVLFLCPVQYYTALLRQCCRDRHTWHVGSSIHPPLALLQLWHKTAALANFSCTASWAAAAAKAIHSAACFQCVA